MTTMATALKKGGVEMPALNQRIWQWIKDNGAHSVVQIAAALKVRAGDASSVAEQMYYRGMVTRKIEKSPGHKGVGFFVYSASNKQKKFELLPLTEDGKNRQKRGSVKSNIEAAVKPGMNAIGTAHLGLATPTEQTVQIIPLVSPAYPSAHMLDKRSVRDAYALYLELQSMFNPGTTA